jgi:hypothetical protein
MRNDQGQCWGWIVRVDVSSEVLRSNLELLKQLINRIEKHPSQEIGDVEAFVEISSGSLIPSLEFKPEELRWRAIQIRWVTDGMESGFFEIYEKSKEGKVLFHRGDFSSEANHILSETMRTINRIISSRISEIGFEKAIHSLKQMQFVSPDSELFISMYYPSMNRATAEQMLKGQPCGTYLFRKDPFAEILEEELSLRFAEPILCFTLTSMLDEERVIDFTVVERLGRYQVYNDDPLLSKPSFSSLINLLQSLFTVCKIPFRK